MADSDKGVSAGTPWEKMHQLYGNGMAFGLKTERGTYPMPEWVIDRIIADHELAQWARQARDALEHGGWSHIWTLLNGFANGDTQAEFVRMEPIAIMAEIYARLATIYGDHNEALGSLPRYAANRGGE